MKRLISICGLAVLTFIFGTPGASFGAYIDFTGGTATLWDTTTFVPNGTTYVEGVDYYVENGFKLDFLESSRSDTFTSIIGDYYGGGNDVIHGHWATGDYGDLTEIRVTKLDGTAFDLNYFILTSNTDTGGGAASGDEQAWINASTDGTTISYSQLLPPDDWGWGGTNPQIWLGSEFDNIMWFSFTVTNPVDCFGMDDFYIDEPGPVGLSLQAPNGGEVLIAGTNYGITWATEGTVEDVLIEYTTDNGSSWTAIDTVPNTESYDWLVPWVDSNQCLVRVSDANDANVSSVSDAVFTIEAPLDLSVTSEALSFVPIPGEPCQPVTISATIWNTGLVAAENVEVVFKDYDSIIDSNVISCIPAGDSNTVSISNIWNQTGYKLITIEVDPYDDISESDETNNSASKLYQVGDVNDMNAFIEVTCSLPAGLLEGSTANINGQAYYRIEVPGESEFVYPVMGGAVSTRIFDSNGVQQELIEVYSNSQGAFALSFQVPGEVNDVFDVNITVTDVNLTGNWQGSFSVIPPPEPGPKKDLWVEHISFDTNNPDIVIATTVYAKADNTECVNDVNVTFTAYPPEAGMQIGSVQYIAEITPGSNEPASAIWNSAPNGLYCVKAELGPGYSDDNNGNNQVTGSLVVGPQPNNIAVVIETPLEGTDVNAGDSTLLTALVTDDNNNVMIPGLLESVTLQFSGTSQSTVNIKPYFDWPSSRYIYTWQPATDANGSVCLEVTAQTVDIIGSVFSDSNSVCVDVNDDVPPAFSMYASPYWAKIGQSVRITVNSSEILTGDQLDSNTVTDSNDRPIPFSLLLHSPGSTRWVFQTDPLSVETALGKATITVQGTDAHLNQSPVQDGYFYVIEDVPDFFVHSEDINFSDEEPNLGDTITIDALIHASSINTVIGPNIPVTFYARHFAGDYQIGDTQYTGQIPPDSNDTVFLLWTNAAKGWYIIEIELGPDFPDRNYQNNQATRALLVGKQCFLDGDFDCDMVYNDYDNCPLIYNPDQNDSDGDGQGDECESYPMCWNFPTQCHGDATGDGFVIDTTDWPQFRDSFGKSYPDADYNPCADYDRDGDIDTVDWPEFRDNFGKAPAADCPPGDVHQIYGP